MTTTKVSFDLKSFDRLSTIRSNDPVTLISAIINKGTWCIWRSSVYDVDVVDDPCNVVDLQKKKVVKPTTTCSNDLFSNVTLSLNSSEVHLQYGGGAFPERRSMDAC